VVCPCHEVAFDFDTGINVTSPEVCDDQKAFQVAVEDGDLYVEGLELDAP
jgi:3-phenylpropionate/trans-cinnamate dioxygenase ferredoxin subunit